MPHRASQLIWCWRNVLLKKRVWKLCISPPPTPNPSKMSKLLRILFRSNKKWGRKAPIWTKWGQKGIRRYQNAAKRAPIWTKWGQKGSKGYPKVSKCSQKGTQRRQDCTLSNQMEPKECPKASKCAKGASRVSKVKPKATQMEPKGQPLRSKWRPTCDKCWIVMDSGIDFGVLLELFGSRYCQQLRQLSMRKSMPKK